MPETLIACPACGARNRHGVALCYLCRAALPSATSLAPGGTASPRREPAAAGERNLTEGKAKGLQQETSHPAAPRSAVHPVPMLFFADAEAANVRMTRVLFASLFAVLFALGGAIGAVCATAWAGAAAAAALFLVLASAAWFGGSSLVLSLHDARPADPARDRRLLNVVEEMAIAADIPVPRAYVMEGRGLNAFAAGRRPSEGAIAVTAGLLEALDREELQGVVAHETAHIRGRDTLYNVCAAVLVGAVALLADMFLRDTPYFGRRGAAAAGAGKAWGGAAALLAGLLLALLAPAAARLLQMSISRQREYRADAAAAALTRNPMGLARALEKIAAGETKMPGVNRGTQHLFIVNPICRFDLGAKALFSTHPPTELRIQRLKAMAGAGGAA